MSMSVMTTPAPGWYPDPAGAAAYRWWDGTAWTEGTHSGAVQDVVPDPVAPVAPVAPTKPPVRKNLRPSKTRWSSLLAAFPVVYPLVVGMSAGIAYAGGAASSTSTVSGIAITVAVLGLIPAWVFAANDRRELLERGYAPAPALLWMLLVPPFAYLVARRRVVGP